MLRSQPLSGSLGDSRIYYNRKEEKCKLKKRKMTQIKHRQEEEKKTQFMVDKIRN